jgi:hypothetical protein
VNFFRKLLENIVGVRDDESLQKGSGRKCFRKFSENIVGVRDDKSLQAGFKD